MTAKAETVTVTEGATLTRLCPELDRRGLIPGNCTTYRVSVSAVADKDLMGTTGKTFVPSLAGGSTYHRDARPPGNVGTP